MTTEQRTPRGWRTHVPLFLWLTNVAAILALTLTGGPLRQGLLRIMPDAMPPLSRATLVALAIAFGIWAGRHARRIPPPRLATAAAAVGAMLIWAWGIHLPSERMHLLLFGTLGITATGALGLRAGLVFVLAWAGIDELIQLGLPDRVADWTDVGLNAASAMAGWLVVFAHRGAGLVTPDRAEP